MIDLRFVPIVRWPGKPNTDRQNARFKSSYTATLRLLKDELAKIDAREVIIQAFFREGQIRQDGWPKANCNPEHPGVILTFKKPAGEAYVKNGRRVRAVLPLSFPCDTYFYMEHNLHAIALSLAALRAVDRYGVTQNAEQYSGWKQIAAPSAFGFDSKEDAAAFMAAQSGFSQTPEDIRLLIAKPEYQHMAYRDAAKRLHPDSPTGSHELFFKLNQAKAVLEGGGL